MDCVRVKMRIFANFWRFSPVKVGENPPPPPNGTDRKLIPWALCDLQVTFVLWQTVEAELLPFRAVAVDTIDGFGQKMAQKRLFEHYVFKF